MRPGCGCISPGPEACPAKRLQRRQLQWYVNLAETPNQCRTSLPSKPILPSTMSLLLARDLQGWLAPSKSHAEAFLVSRAIRLRHTPPADAFWCRSGPRGCGCDGTLQIKFTSSPIRVLIVTAMTLVTRHAHGLDGPDDGPTLQESGDRPFVIRLIMLPR